MRLPASGLSRRFAPSKACDRRDDFQRLGHAADAGLAAFRHLARVRADRERRRRRRAALEIALRRRCSSTCAGSWRARAGSCLSVASSTAVARSSAWPFAILAIRSAVAGATTMRSVSRARRIWPTSNSLCWSNRSVKARSPAIAPTDIGRDEILRGLGHDHPHRDAALAQPADQVERLVGRDPARDDEQDLVRRRLGARRLFGPSRRSAWRRPARPPRRRRAGGGSPPPWSGRSRPRAAAAAS